MPTLSPPRSAWVAVLSLLALLCLLPTGANAATEARATPAETAQLLFVAGDVRRLDRAPSGTVDTVLEQVLQQLYRDDPALDAADAQREIRALRAALEADGRATSSATLEVLPGNQRVLAILAALQRSRPTARAGRALARVADRALTEASTSTLPQARRFNAAADSFSTLLYGSFSPAATLQATTRLAAGNARFGRARDGLWAAASHESVSDDTAALLASNPALRTDAVRRLTAHLTPDGGLTASDAELEDLVRTGLREVGAQTTDALDQHRAVVAACPGAGCQDARDRAKADDPASRAVIAGQHAALTAVSGLLARTNEDYGLAIAAEAQAAAQVAGAVNSYYAATDYGEYIHIAGDVVGLGLSLAESVINPAAAVTGVITVVGDIVGQTVTGPDANALILQGLQGVSQQLSAFASATSAQFAAVDARLEGLSRQVGVLAQQLSTQLAQARAQLTGLSNALATLQTSVDRLGDEVRRLFADTAENRVRIVVNQSLRYEAFNSVRLTTSQFSNAADELLTASLDTSFSATILRMPNTFDALAASGLSEFDPAINFFALFPARATDSTTAWPAALGRDLPDPDFWAASSRAYAQLLLENRDYVTASRLAELDAMLSAGDSVSRALAKLSESDTDSATGNTVFNAALDYYASWLGRDADRASGPPTLVQAIRAEREDILTPLRTAEITSTGPWVDPWGGASQPLRRVDLLGLNTLANVRGPNGLDLPDLRPAPALVENLPAPLVNALRLGIGHVTFSWTAQFNGGVAPQRRGQLQIDFTASYRGPDGRLFGLDGVRAILEGAVNCAGVGDATDAARTVHRTWLNPNDPNCPAVPAEVNDAARNQATSAARRAVEYVTPLVEERLSELQGAVYAGLLDNNGELNHDSDVANAAQRLEGAERLLEGYVTLGLPQALSTDDRLRSLIVGDDSNPVTQRFPDAEPAATVPGQVASLLGHLAHIRPASDPLSYISGLFTGRRADLQNAIAPYVKRGRADGQDPADGGEISQANPLVSSTVDRLQLTRAVLADDIANRGRGGGEPTPPQPPASTPQPAPANPAPATGSPTPTRPAAARLRLVRAPRARGRTITFTVRCLSGTCRPAATLSAGRRPVGRVGAFSLAAGATRTVTVRLNASGRRLLARRHRLGVTVRITAAGVRVATRRVTIR